MDPTAISPASHGDDHALEVTRLLRSRLRLLKAGLAIGFGLPFVCGIAYQAFALAGRPFDFGATWLFADLVTLAGLLILVVGFERLPLGSLGIHRVRRKEVYVGLAAGAGLIMLSAAAAELIRHAASQDVGSLFRVISGLEPAAWGGLREAPFWFAMLVLVVSAFAEELAARGYAIRRLRVATGSVGLAAGAALAIDLVAHVPLWGFRYAVVVAPAEIALVALYLWRRQLSSCVVAHLTLTAAVFAAMVLGGSASTGAGHGRDEMASTRTSAEAAMADLGCAPGERAGAGAASFVRAEAYVSNGDYPHALEQIDEAIRLEPKNGCYFGLRGNIDDALDNHPGAAADFTEMIAFEPKNDAAYRARAREYKTGRDYKSAADDIATAIKLKPDDPENFAERASLHFWKEEYRETIADFDRAIRLDPSNRQYVLEQAYFYQHIGNDDRALSNCDRLVSSDPAKADGFECRANFYSVAGDLNNAIANLGEAIERQPNNAALFAERGNFELQTRLWRQAHADFERVAILRPNDPRITDGVAWALATSGRDEVRDGKAAVVLAIQENELTGYSHWRYLNTLAAAYAEAGDTASAVKWEKAALIASDANDPGDLEWMRELLGVFQAGRAWRELPMTAYSSHPNRAALIATIVTLVLAAFGLVALLFGSGRWLARRAKRARPAAA